MSKLPKWQFEHLQKCRAALGIGHAGFHFYSTPADQVDGDSSVAGSTTTTERYQRAEVTLRRGIKRDNAGYEVLTHEMVHAATGPMRQSVNRIIELVPENLRDHAEELWQDGNEATITRMARGLTPLLRATEHKAESGGKK